MTTRSDSNYCFVDRLETGPLVADGAWGTRLLDLGFDRPDLANLLHPESVLRIAEAYRTAGAEVLTTNTFQANRCSLAASGRADDMERINMAAVAIARHAVGSGTILCGSIGPCPQGCGKRQAAAAYRDQADALLAAGVDALLFETMPSVEEVRRALDAIGTAGVPVIVSFVFHRREGRIVTRAGETPEEVAARIETSIDVIGANCGDDLPLHVEVCRRYRGATRLPIWIKPNAGIPRRISKGLEYPVTADAFAEAAVQLYAAGASVVGGCCGTDETFIARVRQARDEICRGNAAD